MSPGAPKPDIAAAEPTGFPRVYTAVKWVIVASLSILAVMAAAPAATYAQFARSAGSAAAGNVPISGVAPGPANAGGMNNVMVDPSGVGNAARVAAPPPPRISAPVIPKFK